MAMTNWGRGGAVRLAQLTIVGLAVSAASASASARRACSASPAAGHPSCFALVRTDLQSRTEAQVAERAGVKLRHGRPATAAAPSGYGYGPSDLQSAYKLAAAAAANGGNATVAVVDAYNDPHAAADLAQYRSAYGLPACGTGCFEQLGQNGQTSPLPANDTSGWALEESLDLDMVSAICPHCKILLVEANNSSFANLGTAVNAAIAAGAQYVSNSYGGSESSSETSLDSSYYDHPGDVVTASAGDNGYGVSYPAASPDVVAVGGTSLVKASNTRGWSESVWGTSSGGSGTGSGCSAYEPKPSWQTDPDCSNRIVGDVSAVASPYTGVPVYDTYNRGGWLQVGGTSASSPIIASVYALAGPPPSSVSPAQTLYQRPHDLFDVTSGADGSCGGTSLCKAEIGYDAPTGLGTPDGIPAFTTAPVDPTNTVAPTITGTPQDGKTLTAKHGTWSPSTGVTYSYQWEKCSSGTCTPITNATKATLALKAAEVGDSVTVEVTASDADGSTTVTAPSSVGPVTAPAPPELKTAPVISGTLAPGNKLTGSTGSWASPDELIYSYLWELCPGQSPSGCTLARQHDPDADADVGRCRRLPEVPGERDRPGGTVELHLGLLLRAGELMGRRPVG